MRMKAKPVALSPAALSPFALCLALAAVPAWAEDRALIIGNDYADPARAQVVSNGVARAVQGLNDAGFAVVDGSNLATNALRTRLGRLLGDLQPSDTLVILLAGDFAQSQGQTWFLQPGATDAAEQTLASIGGVALNVETVLELAALAPGQSVVLLATDPGLRLPLGQGLKPGIGALDIPQGVAVFTGAAADITGFAADALGQPGRSLAQLSAGARDLRRDGFLPATIPFRNATIGPKTAPVTAPPADSTTEAARQKEATDWAAAQKAGTIAAFEAYLDAHPRGSNAATARAEVSRIRNDPTFIAQQAEEALKLNRDQRRSIQRQLTLLGFDTRGVDGILGRGSRAAIGAWQKSQGMRATGYLSAVEIQRLSAAADRRAAELEAEAAARQARLDAEDRSFWERSGAAGDEDGLRTYLRQYPDGLYAEVASNRLAAIDLNRQNRAAAQDRAAWDQAAQSNSVEGYNAYLSQFPRGAFVAEANARIAAAEEARGGGERDRAAAQAAEDGLALNPITRRLIEQRLTGLGFDPGPADGAFDEKTRRAIRRFQKSRGQPVTGYIDQGSIVALLAGGIFKGGN